MVAYCLTDTNHLSLQLIKFFSIICAWLGILKSENWNNQIIIAFILMYSPNRCIWFPFDNTFWNYSCLESHTSIFFGWLSQVGDISKLVKQAMTHKPPHFSVWEMSVSEQLRNERVLLCVNLLQNSMHVLCNKTICLVFCSEPSPSEYCASGYPTVVQTKNLAP